MAWSPSGIITLLVVVFSGPMCWCLYGLISKRRCQSSEQKPEASGRETVSTIDYTMALLGYAIGIGNVWRFPYVISQNGGCAAVIAYLVCAVFVAVPMYMMEFIVGQHMRLSMIEAYKAIRPRWNSLGVAQGLLVCIVLAYFQMLLAYASIYVVNSLKDPLPWTTNAENADVKDQAAEDFWNKNVLNRYDSLSGNSIGPGQVHLVLALAFVWLVSFFSVAFGKKILARVTWVTVVGPFLLMVILLVRALLLEGAADGIKFYIGKFEASELARVEVWATACSQILFSLSPGFGTAVTMSSFTRPKEDVFRICIVVAVANSAFSLMGGFAMFSIIGELARVTERTVEEVSSKAGPGLAFISIAQAMPYFGPLQNVLSVLFFVMLLALGLDSSFAWCETIICNIEDFLMRRGRPVARWRIVAIVCSVLFVAGMPYCTRMGNELLDVVDRYTGSIFLLASCAVEAIMFNLDFGWARMVAALQNATFGNAGTPSGRRLAPQAFWRTCMHVTTPIVPAALMIYMLVQDLKIPYGGYPAGLLAIGWILFGLLILITPATLLKMGPSKLPALASLAEKTEVTAIASKRDLGDENSENQLERVEKAEN